MTSSEAYLEYQRALQLMGDEYNAIVLKCWQEYCERWWDENNEQKVSER